MKGRIIRIESKHFDDGTIRNYKNSREEFLFCNNPECDKPEIEKCLKYCSDCGSELESTNKRQSVPPPILPSRWGRFESNSEVRGPPASTERESEDVGSCMESTSLLSSRTFHDSDDEKEYDRPQLPSSYGYTEKVKEAIVPKEVQENILIATQSMIDHLYWFSRAYIR